ncbi:MAG: hypothetical protein LC750_17495, partial [Actinobacteria bacterium]|nr:hypothetical protein [Actinomycetota bacterium]
DIPIADTSGISTSGTTGLRLAIDGGEPTGQNSLCLATNDDPTLPGPALLINFVIPPNIESLSAHYQETHFPGFDQNNPYDGDTLRFTATWNDFVKTSAKLLVCRNVLSPVAGACAGGASWADGDVDGSKKTEGGGGSVGTSWANYVTTKSDVGHASQYWAFVCDTSGICSNPHKLLGDAFTVAAKPGPAVRTMALLPSDDRGNQHEYPIRAGDVLTFSMGWRTSEPDAVKELVCRNEVPPVDATCQRRQDDDPAYDPTYADGAFIGEGYGYSYGEDEGQYGFSDAWYTTTQNDVGTKDFWAYACDNHNLCGPALHGTFDVANVSPVITGAPSAAVSGDTISFAVPWSDTPGDAVEALICTTGAINSDSSCGDAAWAYGDPTTVSPATASFPRGDLGPGTYRYYAFVCDTLDGCSASRQGSFTASGAALDPSSDDCGEATLFVAKPRLSEAYGSNNEIFVRSRNLSPATECGTYGSTASDPSEAHSTAHVSSPDNYKFAEVGFIEYWLCPAGPYSGCYKTWRVFAEGGDGTEGPREATTGGTFTGYVITGGHWARFKVDNVSGTNTWNFYYKNDVPAGSYDTVAGPWTLLFRHGIAYGETGRRGPETGAADHQRDLLYKNCDSAPLCDWFSWGGNAFDPGYGTGGISGWQHRQVSHTEYMICNVATNYCPANPE